MTTKWYEGDKLFNLGNVIHGYNLSIFLGVLACFLGIIFFWRRMKYSWTILQVMLIIAIPTGIFGSRLWDVIWDGNWGNFFNFAGLSIQGGVVIGMICVSPYVWLMRRQVDFRTVFSIVIPNILIAQAIGRFGNFFNHELFGKEVSGDSLNWMGLMKQHMFIYDYTDHPNGAYRAPMFFYESMSSIVGWVILVPILLRKNWLKPGVVGALYWVWYGVWRTIFEPMKDAPWIVNGFPVATTISVISIVLGIIFVVYWQWLCFPLKNIEFKSAVLKKYFGWINKVIDFRNARRDKRIKSVEFKSDFAKMAFGWINFIIRLWNSIKIDHRPREYEKITPVKPRKKYEFFGPKTDNKLKYVFFGPEVPNEVIIWLPIQPEERKWSKRELNRGRRNTN